MVAMKFFNSTARKDGRWWVVQCVEEPGAISQVARLDQAEEHQREAISMVTGLDAASFHVSLHVDLPLNRVGRDPEGSASPDPGGLLDARRWLRARCVTSAGRPVGQQRLIHYSSSTGQAAFTPTSTPVAMRPICRISPATDKAMMPMMGALL
jgi:hypothetical protein